MRTKSQKKQSIQAVIARQDAPGGDARRIPAESRLIIVITAASPQERLMCCAWCWPKRHPGEPYPREWSSTMCQECEDAMEAQLAERRATHAAGPLGRPFVTSPHA